MKHLVIIFFFTLSIPLTMVHKVKAGLPIGLEIKVINNIDRSPVNLPAAIINTEIPTVSGITTDTGSSDSDQITNDNTLIFNGIAEPNATVEVFIGGSSIGTTSANGSGVWSFDHTATILAEGIYSVTATATDTGANTSGMSSAMNVIIDTTAPTISVNAFAGDNVVNSLEDDNATAFTGTTTGVEDGQLVSLVFDGYTYTSVVSDNTWRVGIAAVDQQAMDPIEAITVDVSDAAGNAAPQISRVIMHDAVIPQVTLSTSVGDPVSRPFTITIEFTEVVSGFGLNDIDVVNGIASDLVEVITKRQWTAIVTPTAAVTVDIASGKVLDVAGNPNTAANQLNFAFNAIPIDISLSPSSILENSGAGVTVGTLSTTDADQVEGHSYTLVSGDGDADNGHFTIAGNELVAIIDFDRETQSSHSIRVKTTDNHGENFEKVIIINVDNVEEAILRVTGDLNIPPTPLDGLTELEVTLHNDGELDLVVSSITYPEGFGGPVSEFTIPGETNEVITFVFTPVDIQTYSGDITITSNGGVVVLSVTAEGAIVTAIEDKVENSEVVKVYPNPAAELLTIDLSKLKGTVLPQISIYDFKGMIRFDQNELSDDLVRVDVSGFSSGIYLLLLNDGTQLVRKKIMIQR